MMRKYIRVLFVLCLFFAPNFSHAQKNVSDFFYTLKHAESDSTLLQLRPNHYNFDIRTRFAKGFGNTDTLIVLLKNQSKYDVLRKLKGVIVSKSQNYKSASFTVDSVKSLENIELKFEIPKSTDSVYLFLSDFSNGIRKLFCGKANNDLTQKQEDLGHNTINFQKIVIDDSSLVAQIPVKTYKVDGKFQSGEKVLLQFVYRINDLAPSVRSIRLNARAESPSVSLIQVKPQVLNPKQGQLITFVYECVTSENYKSIPVELELIVNEIHYKKEIISIINSNVTKVENTIITQEERDVEISFKENVLSLRYTLPPISWHQSYDFRLTYTFDKNEYKTTQFKSNSSQGIIKENGIPGDKLVRYNLSYNKITNNETLKGLVFCLTPSYADVSHISNFKYGFRFIRTKDIGYYIEANSTMNFKGGDYNYRVISSEMENFDSYKSYYEFENKLRVLSRDLGAGFTYRPSKNLMLQFGLSYYSFKIKQSIDVVDYGNEKEFTKKYATLRDYSFDKLVVKTSICYFINQAILGISFTNYENNQFRPSINIGKIL